MTDDPNAYASPVFNPDDSPPYEFITSADDYWGLCPDCRQHDGFVNIGREHWFVCHRCRTRWCVGENLFDCWKDETADDVLQTIIDIDGYRVVEPLQTDA